LIFLGDVGSLRRSQRQVRRRYDETNDSETESVWKAGDENTSHPKRARWVYVDDDGEEVNLDQDHKDHNAKDEDEGDWLDELDPNLTPEQRRNLKQVKKYKKMKSLLLEVQTENTRLESENSEMKESVKVFQREVALRDEMIRSLSEKIAFQMQIVAKKNEFLADQGARIKMLEESTGRRAPSRKNTRSKFYLLIFLI
jgi:hypothetical protein